MEKSLLVSLLLCISGSLAKSHERIINGDLAENGQFPYQVSLRYGTTHMCGGSIIDESHILTAAHCLFEDDGKPFKSLRTLSVLVGSNDVSPTFPKIFRLAKFTVHEKYNPKDNFINDIAIITLTKKIMFTKFVQRINLPETDVTENSEVILTGWGDLKDPPGPQDKTPKYLRKLQTTVITNEYCGTCHQTLIPQQQLCTLQEHGYGACSGDSGSPLVYNNTVVGIASWVDTFCANGFPDVYTRVFEFVPWINNVLQNDRS